MAKRTKAATAAKRKPDPIEVNQKQRARELARMNAREKQLRRGLRNLRAEIVKTNEEQRAFYEWLGQHVESPTDVHS
jgi:hypothetical protein